MSSQRPFDDSRTAV